MSITSATVNIDPAIQQLWAREMKKEKQKQVAQEAAEVVDEGTTLRQKMAAARIAKETKERVKQKAEEKVMNPARTGTTWVLRAAWLNLINSFGLTLIYINIHVFLHWIFPDIFCELGEEWVPKQVATKSTKNIGGTAFGIVEVMGLILLDLIFIFGIIGLCAIVLAIFDSTFVKLFGWITDLFS